MQPLDSCHPWMDAEGGLYSQPHVYMNGKCYRCGKVQDRPIVIRTCPVCRSPHPADVACKPGECENGGYWERRP